jgi:hypothetical protein
VIGKAWSDNDIGNSNPTPNKILLTLLIKLKIVLPESSTTVQWIMFGPSPWTECVCPHQCYTNKMVDINSQCSINNELWRPAQNPP